MVKRVVCIGELVEPADATCFVNAENEGEFGAKVFEFETGRISIRSFFAGGASLNFFYLLFSVFTDEFMGGVFIPVATGCGRWG